MAPELRRYYSDCSAAEPACGNLASACRHKTPVYGSAAIWEDGYYDWYYDWYYNWYYSMLKCQYPATCSVCCTVWPWENYQYGNCTRERSW